LAIIGSRNLSGNDPALAASARTPTSDRASIYVDSKNQQSLLWQQRLSVCRQPRCDGFEQVKFGGFRRITGPHVLVARAEASTKNVWAMRSRDSSESCSNDCSASTALSTDVCVTMTSAS